MADGENLGLRIDASVGSARARGRSEGDAAGDLRGGIFLAVAARGRARRGGARGAKGEILSQKA